MSAETQIGEHLTRIGSLRRLPATLLVGGALVLFWIVVAAIGPLLTHRDP
ncbi:MAG: hypothetical protein QOK29_3757, partial [Rhodospirillaceae bacterium]|nr:hypothetical protein [Rhodospirillaceae bacterium]